MLSISGGGYAGLFAAEFLRRLEEHLGRPLHKAFQLVAGTSIGGIIALALAKGIPAADVAAMIEDLGPELFGRPRIPLLKPRHDRQALEGRLTAKFGQVTLENLVTAVLVPAVDLTSGDVLVFGNGTNDPSRKARAVDVALATSAAPIYLQPHADDDRLFADGGLAANSPEALAAVEVAHVLCWDVDRTRMLVVGSTGLCGRMPAHLGAEFWGAARWLVGGRLRTTLMCSQMSVSRRLSTRILGANSVTVADVELTDSERAVISLDRVDAKSTTTLKGLASASWRDFQVSSPHVLEHLRSTRS